MKRLIFALICLGLWTLAQASTPIVIRYANWNLGTEEENNLQRQLIAAYMAQNPHVTIELVDMAGGRWDEMLTAYAARGQLPDVFMADNTPLYLRNGWLADLTELVANDPAWQEVPQVLREAVSYEGRVMGLPSAQFVMGYFVNRELFEAANLEAPEYGVSLEDFLAAVTALTDVRRGVLGLDELEFVLGWYPSTQDPSLRWFGFDGQTMRYNAAGFRAAVARLAELKRHSWQGLTETLQTNFRSAGPWDLFINEEVGVRWDGGWAVPSYAQAAAFDWDFMGIPGGNQAMVADILVISATASNLEAAYDFARWMSISREGYRTEAELAQANGVPMSRMPVAVNPETIALYMATVGERPGLQQALENLDGSLLESLAKIVPGYVEARWEGRPGIDLGAERDVNMWYIFHFAHEAGFQYEDYAPQLEAFASRILAEARSALAR